MMMLCLLVLISLGVHGVQATETTPAFLGTYSMSTSVLFEEYMEAVGVGWFLRKLAASASPTTEISKIGDQWDIKTWTTFKTTNIKFKLGDEFDEVTADGRHCKSTITLEGDNKLIHTQHCGALNTEILRTFNGNVMTMTLPFPSADTRVCIRTYTKQ